MVYHQFQPILTHILHKLRASLKKFSIVFQVKFVYTVQIVCRDTKFYHITPNHDL